MLENIRLHSIMNEPWLGLGAQKKIIQSQSQPSKANNQE